ncbi:hypothetical protein RRG08_027469 [Elysia crispata]|uniref:Uncharacterized protein n=1 Tax=Elysia crispata TaxID=231223 RepID=A0AAE1D301_9GAST|nr:hypothetical protein RRG08_027469 [Elysia crispata]
MLAVANSAEHKAFSRTVEVCRFRGKIVIPDKERDLYWKKYTISISNRWASWLQQGLAKLKATPNILAESCTCARFTDQNGHPGDFEKSPQVDDGGRDRLWNLLRTEYINILTLAVDGRCGISDPV